ncbi:2-phosphosulfolactate phosphatase [Knoellia koreensis]|uniref:2-phosphosulfolactate phosphatase n=1 Tax=Knoellia koreensis TaxID=2730921 RepID=A0A849H5D0_9MICO|nr:2-phosphosulfolactate phosphatase [Knoellia sp. DB2414S]NNM44986.1 2-phosphosulfolactate phosphatase [Knoellia sp. DB2414S]
MTGLFGQDAYAVRFDWGPVGATAVGAEVSVVVDVLSFTTSVTVAVERGMRVFPFAWKDSRAQEFAQSRDAVLAVGRLEATRPGAVPAPSLSPAQLTSCPLVPRLVLPSPNGSSITTVLQDSRSTDDVFSPEARSAADLFVAVADAGRLDESMHNCVGGRELIAKGFVADVDVAAELDASTTVPVLVDGAFAPIGQGE